MKLGRCCRRKSSAKTGSLVTHNCQRKLVTWEHKIVSENLFAEDAELSAKTSLLKTQSRQRKLVRW